jgi:hypothetical protein
VDSSDVTKARPTSPAGFVATSTIKLLRSNVRPKTLRPSNDSLFDPPSYPSSIPRIELLASLQRMISSAPVAALVGLSGSGKSYAASSYVTERRAQNTVLWHDPESGESLDTLLLGLKDLAGLAGPTTNARCKQLLSWLREHDRLLVVDDCHAVDQTSYGPLLEHASRFGAPATVLLLSQTFVEPQGPIELSHQVRVDGFSVDEASEYLAGHGLGAIDPAAVSLLVEKTSGLPFAIMLFTVLVNQHGRDPIELLDGSIAATTRIRQWFDGLTASLGPEVFDLLKRLSLCTGAFNMGVVRLLSAASAARPVRNKCSGIFSASRTRCSCNATAATPGKYMI